MDADRISLVLAGFVIGMQSENFTDFAKKFKISKKEWEAYKNEYPLGLLTKAQMAEVEKGLLP